MKIERIKINNICKESKSLTLNIETIYSIYEAIRYDIPNLQRIITISGEGIKNPQNIVVKNGTKANEVIDEKEAEKSLKKMQSGKYDLEDFLTQMKQMKKLGSLESLLKLIPGAKKMGLNNIKIDPKDMAHVEAIILSMTPYERRHPEVLKASRKERIAKGSGRPVMEVNRLITQFEQSKKMMKQLSSGNFKMPF